MNYTSEASGYMLKIGTYLNTLLNWDLRKSLTWKSWFSKSFIQNGFMLASHVLDKIDIYAFFVIWSSPEYNLNTYVHMKTYAFQYSSMPFTLKWEQS